MKEKKLQEKQPKPLSKPLPFQWGQTTTEWEEEADQFMNYLQDQIDHEETKEEKQKKIEYGKQKQYW
ncbi:MAG: hypothetical protein ACOYVK_01765 [Bacillota bacterium]